MMNVAEYVTIDRKEYKEMLENSFRIELLKKMAKKEKVYLHVEEVKFVLGMEESEVEE